jgi:hypothetical protein
MGIFSLAQCTLQRNPGGLFYCPISGTVVLPTPGGCREQSPRSLRSTGARFSTWGMRHEVIASIWMRCNHAALGGHWGGFVRYTAPAGEAGIEANVPKTPRARVGDIGEVSRGHHTICAGSSRRPGAPVAVTKPRPAQGAGGPWYPR